MTPHFAHQDRQACEQWRREKLSRLTIPNSPETLARLHGIYAFHSSLLQNIEDFTPGNFHISVLTQPFVPSRPDALSRLPAAHAAVALEQCLALLDAARKWNMNFIDFSRFQVLPTGSLRFAWTLESKELPATGDIIRLFRDHRNLRSGSPPRGRRSQADASPPRGRRSQADASPYLCRREDFAS
ncbi:MAG: hypothetical protein PHX05_03035, partial [Acidobacteriota bacterium]|nr:hypothetical protein [Acidobacteriota bacterium]